MTRLGHQVVAVAKDGRQLVEQCRQTCPDLVISDVKMPQLSGIDAVATLNQEREVPAVLVSAHPEGERLARSKDKPRYIVTCLRKPVRSVDVQAAMALARRGTTP